MDKLFLLKPGFSDVNVDQEGRMYYCPSCAAIEGLLSYYPHLREKLEIIYVDFPRPRTAIVDLIGEANQGCPVLVIGTKGAGGVSNEGIKEAHGNYFISATQQIMAYLAATYTIGFPHP